MGANGSWWFPTGKKHQELIVPDGFGKKHQEIMVPDDFLIGKKESGTKRHHQGICPWFHCFFPLLEPMGDLLLGPMGGPIRGPVEETLRKKPSETSRDHYKKPLGKSHQKPLGTIRPLGNWDTIRTPLEETIRTPLGKYINTIRKIYISLLVLASQFPNGLMVPNGFLMVFKGFFQQGVHPLY